MESYVLDWASLLLRWLHVVAAMAWVGASFYFVFLDSNLTPPQDPALRQAGAGGELWAVHGGGFYHPVKYPVAPPQLPARLHWFYWESYTTWLSGFALFALTYLWQARVYLVQPVQGFATPVAAAGTALAFLIVFWLLYDGLCRMLGQRRHGDTAVALGVVGLVALAAWLACRWFPGRSAFLLVGAMLATAMTANVAHWIIPGQRKVVAALRAGQPIDPQHAARGKQRSVHNTYFTLPVLLAMLSPHYGFLSAGSFSWLVLLALMAAGAGIRHFFVLRHGWKLGRCAHPWPFAAASVGVLAVVALALGFQRTAAPSTPSQVASASAEAALAFAPVQAVVAARCLPCHSGPQAMKGLRLDTPALIGEHAQAIYQQAVLTRTMPLNNATGITEAERRLLRQWYEAGARVAHEPATAPTQR